MLLAAVHLDRNGATVGVGQGGLEGLGQAATQVVAHLETIDDDLDVVTPSLLQRRHGVQFHDLSIDAYAYEALRAQIGKQIVLLALAASHDRRQDHHRRYQERNEAGAQGNPERRLRQELDTGEPG